MREAVQREESSHAELFKRHENHLRSVRDGEQDFKVQIEKSQKEMKEMKDAMTMKHESEISNLLGTLESERDVFREAKLNVRNLEAHLETTEQSSMAKYRSMEKHYARERMFVLFEFPFPSFVLCVDSFVASHVTKKKHICTHI